MRALALAKQSAVQTERALALYRSAEAQRRVLFRALMRIHATTGERRTQSIVTRCMSSIFRKGAS